MEKTKKIKLFIGLFYAIIVSLFLFLIFSNFSIHELTSYDFIKNNRDYFFSLRQSNLFLLSILFILFSILWIFAAGFLSPLAIFSGFIFGKWLGLILLIFGTAVGATMLYAFANFFLKELIRDKFLVKFKNLEEKFKKSELLYLLIYRFVGGIPFVLSNVLPCIFNVKIFNFFLATLIGIIPQVFLVVSIGSGIEEVIDKNSSPPTVIEIISSPSVYLPLIVFVILVFITIVLKKFFYKK
jgi:uncharacterized membrane protein YdjX (TVP38/TMEM64 family)